MEEEHSKHEDPHHIGRLWIGQYSICPTIPEDLH